MSAAGARADGATTISRDEVNAQVLKFSASWIAWLRVEIDEADKHGEDILVPVDGARGLLRFFEAVQEGIA